MSATTAERLLARKAEREAAEAAEAEREQVTAQSVTHAGAQRASPDERGRDELMEMCAQVDIAELAREFTGEQGRASGGRVYFESCPVCGHNGCFCVHPDTKSWECWSDSNPNRKSGKRCDGGNVLDLLERVHGGDKTAAIKDLRERTNRPFVPKPKARGEPDARGEPGASAAQGAAQGAQDAQDGEQGGKGAQDAQGAAQDAAQGVQEPILPTWEAIKAHDPPKRNPPLIDKLLRLGHVLLLAAKGKAGKSWSAIELAIAVVFGGIWFGFQCMRGNVLYIDPEIDSKSLDNRFAEVCRAQGVDAAEVDAHVAKWPLRGVANASMENIVHDLEVSATYGQFSLVIIDSCSVFVEGDENSSRDIRNFAAEVLRIAEITGAAVLLVQHYGKGNAGDRDTADRARGSSVWLDFPDATLFLTETFPPSGEASDYLEEGERAFILESGGLREFPPMEPKRILFKHPEHKVDEEGVTDGWKPSNGQRRGADKTNELKAAKTQADRADTAARLLAHYYAQGVGEDGLILKDAAEAVGIASKTLVAVVESTEYFEIVRVTERKRYVRAKRTPPTPPPELPLESD